MGTPPEGIDWPDSPCEEGGEDEGEDGEDGEDEGDEGGDGLPGIEGGELEGIGEEEGIDGMGGLGWDCCGELQPTTPIIRSKYSTPEIFVIAHPPTIIRPYWLQVYPILLERRTQWEFALNRRFSGYF